MAGSTTGGARTGGSRPRSIQLPGIVLGVGMGGFVDGILLHQVLQWHHMLSSTDQDHIGVRYYDPDTVSGLEMNTVWDGIFHTVCWLAVLLGLAILYARVTHDRLRVWTSRVLWGWMLVGWGLFNLAEGVLDHHVLGVHHVYAGAHQLWWDLAFLAVGVLLVAAGLLLQRGATPFAPAGPGGSRTNAATDAPPHAAKDASPDGRADGHPDGQAAGRPDGRTGGRGAPRPDGRTDGRTDRPGR